MNGLSDRKERCVHARASQQSPANVLVTPPGLEPGTNGLKVRCSAIELEGRAPLGGAC